MDIISRIRKINYEENYYLLLAVGFCVALRILTPQMIGFGGGDTIESWDMARRILFNEDYYLIHRTARFGTIIPICITQVIFGTHPLVYYIAPALASVIQTIFFFKTADLIRGKIFAFITTIAYLSFPQMIRELSHPRVSVFATMFFLIALYYALRFYMDDSLGASDNPGLTKYLFISGTNVFFFYMAKEDSLYFLPALMLVIYLRRKRFSDLVLFGIIPFSLFISETLLYHFFTEFSLGRLSIVTGKHFDSVAPLPGWISLFDRFYGVNLRPYFRYPLIFSLIGGIFLLIRKKTDNNGRIKPIVFVVISLFIYLFFLTFLVKSIHPVIPLNTFRTRYMNIVIAPMILVISYVIFEIFSIKMKKNESGSPEEKIISIINKYKHWIILTFLFMYTLLTVAIFSAVYKNEAYKGTNSGFWDLHPFRLVYNYDKIITGNYYSGKPVALLGVKEKQKRFAEIISIIDNWIKSGMTLEEACIKYGITPEMYQQYRYQIREKVVYGAEAYLDRIFLYHGRSFSGIESFECNSGGNHLKLIYNKYLTDSKTIIRDHAESSVYPLITYPPFTVSLRQIDMINNAVDH